MRRLLFTVLAALAFCGVAAAASARGPQYQFDATDQSWTDGIILSAKDVGGGWRSSGMTETITGGETDAATCSGADMSDLVLTAGTYSPDFSRSDGAYVSSSAVVWQTADQAQADWDRNLQPAIMGCLAAALQGASTKKVKVVVTSRRQMASWPALAPRSVAFRLALKLTARVKVHGVWHAVSARATYDFIAVGSGRARAMLFALSFDSQPLSDFNKQQWLMLMAQRMSADPAAAK